MFLASSLIKTQLKWWTVHVLTKKYWRFSLCNISNSLNMILPKVENNHDEVWMIFLFGKKYRVFECFLLLENIYLVINVFKITLQFRRSKTSSSPALWHAHTLSYFLIPIIISFVLIYPHITPWVFITMKDEPIAIRFVPLMESKSR